MKSEHELSRARAEFKNGVRYAIAWLHEQALQMNDPDPKARAILNSAAFQLGQKLKRVKADD